jgi:4-hydroxy-2-oxoheptanedioate aldolase
VLCLPMIESRAGLDAVETIAAVEGVDGLFVGPADLALDLGVEGAELDEALARIARACHEHGKLAGAFGMGAARIPGWVDLGYEFLAVDSDASFLLAAARAALSDARRALPQASTRG